ncbi:hypothetical protein [Persicobacter psychrovividus]
MTYKSLISAFAVMACLGCSNNAENPIDQEFEIDYATIECADKTNNRNAEKFDWAIGGDYCIPDAAQISDGSNILEDGEINAIIIESLENDGSNPQLLKKLKQEKYDVVNIEKKAVYTAHPASNEQEAMDLLIVNNDSVELPNDGSEAYVWWYGQIEVTLQRNNKIAYVTIDIGMQIKN